MNLAELAKLKARGMAKRAEAVERPAMVDVTTMKSEVLRRHFGGKETCGSCTRWETCTILHRNHRVSPMLVACECYQFDLKRKY